MAVTVFTRSPSSIYATSSEALVQYLGVDAKLEYVAPVNKDAKFTSLFGENNRFTPSLEDTEANLVLNQAVAVNRYILSLAKDKKGLQGKEFKDEYLTLQWANRADSDVLQKILGPVFDLAINGEPTQAKVNSIIETANHGFSVFEDYLKKNTYLVGEQLTLADIESAGLFFFVLSFLVDAKWQKEHPSIVRWAKTVLNGPAYAKKFKGSFAFSKDGDVEGATKGIKACMGLLPAEKKQEKSAKAPAAEPQQPAKPAKHPLELLGKPSTPIDALKRNYSNKETREEVLPWFWNEFYNDEEWSIWKVDFKYNDELTLTFMSNNLIGGFFARLSASVKYMFGAAVVFGENNNNGIRGAYVVRGKEFEPAFDVAPDWESYNFTRLDASKPEDREELNDLWAWDKPIIYNGKPYEIADGKVLK